MEKSEQILPFSEITKFHGHSCPGTAIGYRAGEIAMKYLLSSRATDEELVAVVENDSCSVDAIQVVTGCTFGKGNLIFKDYGKQTYTFINRDNKDVLRMSLNKSVDEMDPEFAKIRKTAFSESASKEDELEYEKHKEILIKEILNLPAPELFKIDVVDVEIPEKARIFQSVECVKCGELVSEHRARVENGNFVCIPCFDDYSKT